MSSAIEDEVGRSRIMEDGNESLLTMGLQHNNTSNHNNDMNIGNNKEVIPNANVMDRFTFTTDQPSQMDEHILDVLSGYKEDLPMEVISLLYITGVSTQAWRWIN